jgi:hypothetical protein
LQEAVRHCLTSLVSQGCKHSVGIHIRDPLGCCNRSVDAHVRTREASQPSTAYHSTEQCSKVRHGTTQHTMKPRVWQSAAQCNTKETSHNKTRQDKTRQDSKHNATQGHAMQHYKEDHCTAKHTHPTPRKRIKYKARQRNQRNRTQIVLHETTVHQVGTHSKEGLDLHHSSSAMRSSGDHLVSRIP